MINIIYYLLKKFSRNAYIKIFSILLVLFSLIVIIQCSCIKSVVLELEDLNTIKLYRSVEIIVENNEVINKLKDLKYVRDVVSVTHFADNVKAKSFMNSNFSGEFIITGISDASFLNVISGPKKGDLGLNSLVCPKYFTPGDKEVLFDIEKVLGDEIEITFKGSNKSLEKTFRLDGLYQNNKLINDNNICYINRGVYQELMDYLYHDYDSKNYIVVLDNYKSRSKLNEVLEHENIKYQNLVQFNLSDYYSYIIIMIVGIIFFASILIVVLYFITRIVIMNVYQDSNFVYVVENNKKDLAISLAISFIFYWLFISILILSIILCFSSIIISLSDYYLYIFKNKVIAIDYLAYIYSIVIILIIILIHNYRLIKEAKNVKK